MSERRPWTAEEDRLLRAVFESSQLRKWSHIARRLQEEYGVRGRNGKQCRQRYLSNIDCSLKREEWSFAEEQLMMQLHNQIGNKWAIIGSKVANRSDNSVKNHFYSRLRKGLRKVNSVALKRSSAKQVKPNVLYRIVEVAEESFKGFPNFDKDFSLFANQLKNELFDFAYDDEVEEKEQGEPDEQTALEIMTKLSQFTSNYKRKPKKLRKGSASSFQDQIVPQNHPRSNTEEESEGSSFPAFSDTCQFAQQNQNTLMPPQPSKRTRRASEETTTILLGDRIRTRASTQTSQEPIQNHPTKASIESQTIEHALQGLNIVQVQSIMPSCAFLRQQSYSRSEQDEFRFFEESHLEMRMLPEMTFPIHKDSQHEENLFFI